MGWQFELSDQVTRFKTGRVGASKIGDGFDLALAALSKRVAGKLGLHVGTVLVLATGLWRDEQPAVEMRHVGLNEMRGTSNLVAAHKVRKLAAEQLFQRRIQLILVIAGQRHFNPVAGQYFLRSEERRVGKE